MNYKSLGLILITYFLLIGGLGYVVQLYYDIFIDISDATPDEGYYLYSLIIFVPVPLFIAALVNFLVDRVPKPHSRLLLAVKIAFPFVCLILTPCQFLILSIVDNSQMVCFLISILLLCASIFFFFTDLKHIKNR